jgi:hypothetical protein
MKAYLEFMRGNHQVGVRLLNAGLKLQEANPIITPAYFCNAGVIHFVCEKYGVAAFYFQKALFEFVRVMESPSCDRRYLARNKLCHIAHNCGIHALFVGKSEHALRAFEYSELASFSDPFFYFRKAQAQILSYNQKIMLFSDLNQNEHVYRKFGSKSKLRFSLWRPHRPEDRDMKLVESALGSLYVASFMCRNLSGLRLDVLVPIIDLHMMYCYLCLGRWNHVIRIGRTRKPQDPAAATTWSLYMSEALSGLGHLESALKVLESVDASTLPKSFMESEQSYSSPCFSTSAQVTQSNLQCALATLHAKRGDLRNASVHTMRALELDVSNPTALRLRLYMYLRLGGSMISRALAVVKRVEVPTP